MPGNAIYTTNAHGLDVWQANTGNHLWSYRAAGTVADYAGIAVHGGVAYFGGADGRVYAVVGLSIMTTRPS